MVQVRWTRGALADLKAVRAYIQQFSPSAAERVAGELVKAARSLEWSPQRGRSISRDRRELAVILPYLIRYRIADERVWILEIRHSARLRD